jgi:translation initiation factor IF-2
MSEERIIRINKVLRELNISLERAVDYQKIKDCY